MTAPDVMPGVLDSDRVADLERRIAALEAKVAELSATVARLKARGKR